MPTKIFKNQGFFCFCSDEMQQCRIWRAKQKGGLIDDNRDNLRSNQHPRALKGYYRREAIRLLGQYIIRTQSLASLFISQPLHFTPYTFHFAFG